MFPATERWGNQRTVLPDVGDAPANVVRLCRDGADRGELKLISLALRDLRRASAQFKPYIGQPKCSVFGSARTKPGEPAY